MIRSYITAVNRDRSHRYGAFVASVAERARQRASYNPLSERTIQNPYPSYTRFRKVTARAFTKPRLMALEPTTEALAEDTVERGEVE